MPARRPTAGGAAHAVAAPAGTREPSFPNHVARRHSEEVIRSFAETAPGERRGGKSGGRKKAA